MTHWIGTGGAMARHKQRNNADEAWRNAWVDERTNWPNLSQRDMSNALGQLQQAAAGDMGNAAIYVGTSTGTLWPDDVVNVYTAANTYTSQVARKYIDSFHMRRYTPPPIKTPDGKLIRACLLQQLQMMAVERAREVGLHDEANVETSIRVMFGIALMEINQLRDRIAALEAK